MAFLSLREKFQARSIIDDGFLHALVGDFASLPTYWNGMKKDFPDHPVCGDSRLWNQSIGCTLYCNSNFTLGKLLFLFCFHTSTETHAGQAYIDHGEPIVHHSAPAGDEIDTLNDSWLFLIWSSDHSPCLSNSVCSRWPIAVIPKSLYLIDSSEVNLTIRAATSEIVTSFNRLSNMGIKIRDLPSMGTVPAT